jgi:hypothetical protein
MNQLTTTSHTLTLAPNPPKVLVLTAFSEAVMSKYTLVYSRLVNYCLLKNKKGENTYTHTHTHAHTQTHILASVRGERLCFLFSCFAIPCHYTGDEASISWFVT